MSRMKAIVFDFIQNQIYTNQEQVNGLTTKQVDEALNLQRSNASTLLNQLVQEKKLVKSTSRPVLYSLAEPIAEKDAFDVIIGANQSLKNAIQLAKAAVLYPKNPLNVLIQAKPGCGTSYFVDTLVDFAKQRQVLTKEAPYIKINCRNYSKDPHLLDEDLFGTNEDYANSVFEKAWSGILFLEAYDSLNTKQQNKILDFLNNKIPLFQEKKQSQPNNVMVILSIMPSKELLINQAIPLTIELPEIEKRSYKERFDLINHFFSREAVHSRRTIVVPSEVIRGLLLANFSYQVKELKMDITAACAKGYVRVINEGDQDIALSLADFKPEIKQSLLRVKENAMVFDELFGNVEHIIYDKNEGYLKEFGKNERLYLYEEIRNQYQSLSESGINELTITPLMNKYVQNLFNKYNYYNVFDDQYNITQLAKIVDAKVIQIVDFWLKTCKKELNREFKSSVFYGLCLHINSLLTLASNRQTLSQEEVTQFIQQYPEEYALSVQLSIELKKQLNLNLPKDEIILILLFLINQEQTQLTGHPVLLYIMHGNRTASSLAETTNMLTQTNNIYSYDMKLDSTPRQSMIEIKQVIKRIDQGQGVIVLYDMGSIKTIVETIAEELNCKLRLIYLPITLIGIEAARKSAMETDIDYVYHTVSMSMNDLLQKAEKGYELIITLCHTGEGGAEQLKRYIESYSKLGMKVKALAISSRNELIKEVSNLKKVYKVHAFVGTYDPNIFGIPFISIGKVFETPKETLDRLLLFEPVKTQFFDYTEVYNYLADSFKYTDIGKLKMVLPEVIDEICALYPLSLDQSIGLFMHLACLIERLLENRSPNIAKANLAVMKTFKQDALIIAKILRKLEKSFDVLINDLELSTILLIIKKL
ncbi:PRD domain-containing protein [Enterococcus casseliflavus]|uniref:PRD domain-containing protein n=1 Tax=Enterococcus casseliflavus TaxID=37734 RepID=UPI001917A4B5|nr:PRD domain-containing protein [Enterococcus casseliflavus]QQU20813.1 PRD domain-containing protein [Enterococcus casseliflavus]